MSIHLRYFFILALGLMTLIGCSGPSSQGSSPDYQTTKKMVIDMLKSDDGKKAIQDILSEDNFKQQLVINQDVVKKTIIDTLTSDKGKKLMEGMFKDPDFSKTLAKAMQKDNEQLLKQLMKDPEYQSMLMDVFEAPNMEKEYLSLLKTEPFRAQIQKNILEAVSSPLFSSKLTDALNKAVNEQMKKSSSKGEQSGE